MGQTEYQDYIRQCHQAARRESDALGNQVANGKLIVRLHSKTKRVHYVIIKAQRNFSKVEWRGYEGDRIAHPSWGWRTTIATYRLAALIDEDESIRKLFDISDQRP